MTTTHLILTTVAPAARLTWRLVPGASFFFPEPLRHGIARHAKGACQAAQGTAFLVSAQNFCALFFGIPIWLGRFAATAVTVVTEIALLLIFCEAVFHEVVASTVGARHKFGNHSGEGITSLPLEPLPKKQRFQSAHRVVAGVFSHQRRHFIL